MGLLTGKIGLIYGVRNERSMAWGCAKSAVREGASLILTYLGDREEKDVRALAASLGDAVKLVAPCDLTDSAQVEALHHAAVVDEVHPVALDGDRRGHAGLGPVVVDVFFAFGDGQLPFEGSGGLGEAEHDAAIAFASGIPWQLVIGANEDASPGDHGGGVGFGSGGTQGHAPPDVGSVGRIECRREVDLGGGHVP